MIKATNLKKTYNDRTIFDNIDFSINQGNMVAVTGASGVGKTTFLNILSGIENRDGGELELFGKKEFKAGDKYVRKLWRNKIGFLFQNYGLIEDDTVMANMQVAQRFSVKDKSKISEALYKVGLKDFENKKIFTLSGGERQRVAIARLLIKPCELVFADEPTGNLDDVNGKEMINLFKQLKDSGKAIIVVTHNKNMLKYFDYAYNLTPHSLDKLS